MDIPLFWGGQVLYHLDPHLAVLPHCLPIYYYLIAYQSTFLPRILHSRYAELFGTS